MIHRTASKTSVYSLNCILKIHFLICLKIRRSDRLAVALLKLITFEIKAGV
jgi:hypothetical protein